MPTQIPSTWPGAVAKTPSASRSTTTRSLDGIALVVNAGPCQRSDAAASACDAPVEGAARAIATAATAKILILMSLQVGAPAVGYGPLPRRLGLALGRSNRAYRDRMVESKAATSTASCEALCVTVADGVSAAALQAALVEPETQEFASVVAAADWVAKSESFDRRWVAVGTVDGLAFAWEPNGFLGSELGRAEVASAGGKCVSVFWNVNMDASFVYAVEGHVVRQFDPVLRETQQGVGDVLTHEATLDWVAAPAASALELQAALIGAPVADVAWLELPNVDFLGYVV